MVGWTYLEAGIELFEIGNLSIPGGFLLVLEESESAAHKARSVLGISNHIHT
jgi:hypothetical protein